MLTGDDVGLGWMDVIKVKSVVACLLFLFDLFLFIGDWRRRRTRVDGLTKVNSAVACLLFLFDLFLFIGDWRRRRTRVDGCDPIGFRQSRPKP